DVVTQQFEIGAVDLVKTVLASERDIYIIGKYETTHKNLGNLSTSCKHDLRLDEEIDVYYRLCRWVETEISIYLRTSSFKEGLSCASQIQSARWLQACIQRPGSDPHYALSQPTNT
ncbi:hypothetical protein RYX36_031193, partial [Vicia faba]